MSSPELLGLDGVSVAYGKRRALDGVSLTVAAGEIVTLLGANGSGKSTTLRTISGLVRPTAGRVVFDGRDITRRRPTPSSPPASATCPRGARSSPSSRCARTCWWAGHTAARAAVAEGTERAFALFPVLGQRARQLAGTLSGGEQQMLAIARALMIRPRLLLLDEPSLGLSPRLAREIFDVIARLNAEGTTILLVEQNARRALALASRAYVLETGRVVVSGPARELAADPRIRAAYLGLAEPAAP